MKYIYLIFLALCMLTKPVEAASSANLDTLKVKTQTYCDHCRECGSCWPRMEKNLSFLPGVKHVSYNEDKMLITVVYNSKKTTPEKIRKEISKSGFDADDVKADVKAQGKLDGCCKKR